MVACVRVWALTEHALRRARLRGGGDARALRDVRAGNTCLLVAYHNDKVQPGQCRSTVGKLADFLKEQGI